MLTPPLPVSGEEVVQQSREAVTRTSEDPSRGCLERFSRRQSRVLKVMDILVNVVVCAVVDASVYVFVLLAIWT